jgi:hypothetical protein
MTTITLYRPVGPEELALIEAAAWRAFPPRLPEQPIFYPVTNEEYAIQIARDWNTKDGKTGYVTRFEVSAKHLSRYERKIVGGRMHEEYWIPAEELEAFNAAIIHEIEVIHVFTEADRLAHEGNVGMSASFSEADLRSMHRHSSGHRDEILQSELCGCFYCEKTFAPSAVEEWIDDGRTALCPKCSIDSVLGDRASKVATDADFLQQMHKFWFEK